MQWTHQLAVALLNIIWVAFFLTPDPFSVFVQRRSTNEDIHMREFCIHLPAATVPSNKSNSTNTTSQDHAVQPTPAPGSEPTKMDWDDLEVTTSGSLPKGGLTNPGSLPKGGLTTPGSLPEGGLTTPDSLPKGGLTNPASLPKGGLTDPASLPKGGLTTPGSFPEGVLTTPGSLPKGGLKKLGRFSEGGLTNPGSLPERRWSSSFLDDCCFEFFPRRVNKKYIKSYYFTDYRCDEIGAILMTRMGRHICVDPSLPWVEDIMNNLDKRSQDHTVQPTPAPGSEPTKMDWDELELTTSGSLPKGGLTTPGRSLEPGQTSTDDTSTFELAPTKRSGAIPKNKFLIDSINLSCCTAVARIRIPISQIKKYTIQESTGCPIEAIVFITTRGRHICIDPDAPWVERVLRILDENGKKILVKDEIILARD